MTENKTLLISSARAYIFDYSIMTYSIFEDIQGIQGIEEKDINLLQAIKDLSNSGHVTQHLLEGCKYVGKST